MANTCDPETGKKFVFRSYLCALVVLPVVQFSGPKYFKGQCEVVQKIVFHTKNSGRGGGGGGPRYFTWAPGMLE